MIVFDRIPQQIIDFRESDVRRVADLNANSVDLAEFLDAYGFDVYSFSSKNEKINYGDYRATIVPGGDAVHCSLTAH